MAPRQQYNRAQIRQFLLNRLQQSPFWTTAELNGLINEGIRTWNCLTGQWKRKVLINTVARNPYYVLPSNLIFGMHIEFNGATLAQSSLTQWDRAYYLWEGEPSTPSEWAPVDLCVIAIRPTDAVGYNQLAIDGVSAAPILTADAQYIDMSEDDYNAYVGYLQYLAAFKEGGQEFESVLPLHQAFLKQASTRNDKLLASTLFRRAMGINDDEAGQRPRRSRSQLAPVGER